MRRVGRVAPVAPPRAHDAHRRLAAFHVPRLHRARLRPQQQSAGQIERVLHVARDVVRGRVQGVEVVVLRFDVGPVGHGEAHAAEDRRGLVDELLDRMQPAAARPAPGQGKIERAGLGHLRRRLQRRLALGHRRRHARLEAVEGLAHRRFVRRARQLRQRLRRQSIYFLDVHECSSKSRVFHAMEKSFPHCGKIPVHFSTSWKNRKHEKRLQPRGKTSLSPKTRSNPGGSNRSKAPP